MTLWAEVRHPHLVKDVPKRELARRLKLDVKTVRRAMSQKRPQGDVEAAVDIGKRAVGLKPKDRPRGARRELFEGWAAPPSRRCRGGGAMRNLAVVIVVVVLCAVSCEGLNEALGSLTSPTPTTPPQPTNYAPTSANGKTFAFSFSGCGLSIVTVQVSGTFATVTAGGVTNQAGVAYVKTSNTAATMNFQWPTTADRFDLTFTSGSGGTFTAYIGIRACRATGTFTMS